ncbi:hypothetical protein [Mannheimia massilioguelmaensis]|uniref:hypothetical protein n=1 Tax=Mannheimia massilioguelmaensis TaxID=1604354 RepID=UPI0005C8A9E0|nr:hypothetical protein [Mannheimia massilioguelmaensis]
MKKLLLSLLLSITTFPTMANLSSNDKHLIEKQLGYLEQSFQQKQWNSVLNIAPPRLLERMASQAGMDVNTFKLSLMNLATSSVKSLRTNSYGYDLTKAISGKTSVRDYAFIPAYYDVNINGKQKQGKAYLLGIEDNKQWYFIHWDNQFKDAMKNAYPDLANIQEPK